MTITFPDTKDVIDEIRNAIGRPVIFVVEDLSTVCPVCTLDPVTNTSTNSFCTICSGTYYIAVELQTTLTGHITWGKADKMNWVSGGQFFEGDCRLQIEYNTDNRDLVNNCKYLIVDGKKLSVLSTELRGVKDINRIVLSLQEQEV